MLTSTCLSHSLIFCCDGVTPTASPCKCHSVLFSDTLVNCGKHGAGLASTPSHIYTCNTITKASPFDATLTTVTIMLCLLESLTTRLQMASPSGSLPVTYAGKGALEHNQFSAPSKSSGAADRASNIQPVSLPYDFADEVCSERWKM